MTTDAKFTIQDDFPPVSYEQWRATVEERLGRASFEEELVTRTYEGFDVQPLYCRCDKSDVTQRPIIDGGWELRHEHAHPDLNVTRKAIFDDVQGGATSLLLRFDSQIQRGLDPGESEKPSLDGLMVCNLDDLESAIGNVPIHAVGIALDAGAAYLPIAAVLIALWQRRDTDLSEASCSINADPFVSLVRDGFLPITLDDALTHVGDLAEWTAKHLPRVRAVGVDTSAYHDAGATATQELALAVATGVEYLRAMPATLDINSAAKQFEFHFSVGTDHFLSIAKLRASRQLWSRVIAMCGGSDEARQMRVHARTSNRVLTQRDPYINLIRNTIAVFSAGIGGANVITSLPFDRAIGQPDELSRRVARNTVRVLQDEAHLDRVIDPAGGSWFINQLTQQVADKSWELFQEIERLGGMRRALESGWVHEQIDSVYAQRRDDFASGKAAIVGVTEFANEDEQPSVRTKPEITRTNTRPTPDLNVRVNLANPMPGLVDAATRGATIGQMARVLGFHTGTAESITPFPLRRNAAPFEEVSEV